MDIWEFIYSDVETIFKKVVLCFCKANMINPRTEYLLNESTSPQGSQHLIKCSMKRSVGGHYFLTWAGGNDRVFLTEFTY